MSTDIKQVVRDKYGEAARRVMTGAAEPSCCGSQPSCCDPITADLYEARQTQGLPEAAVLASQHQRLHTWSGWIQDPKY